jgi:YidC/Oxa1 family membrane protein insertase
MTVSSIAYGYYNNQMTPDTQASAQMPIDMKKMAYIMPVVFMLVMNTFPAGLSFYYLVSNLVTIAQQLIIRKFVDEDKIKSLLDENRKKFLSGERKQGRFAQMLEKQLKAAEDLKKQQESAESNKKKKK